MFKYCDILRITCASGVKTSQLLGKPQAPADQTGEQEALSATLSPWQKDPPALSAYKGEQENLESI